MRGVLVSSSSTRTSASIAFMRLSLWTARIAVSGSFGSMRRSPWRSRMRASVSARTAALYGTAFASAVTSSSPEV